MIKIIEVENKRDLIKFIEMPYKIYKEYNFVPLLKRMEIENLDPNGKSPAFKKMDLKYFIAYKNNEPAGRIIAYTAKHPVVGVDLEKTGFFGYFECINDQEVAEKLFEKVEEFLKNKGKKEIIGPASFAYDGLWGIQIEGFDRMQMIMIPFHPPYYKDLLEKCKFKKKIDFFAWHFNLENEPEERIEKAKKMEDMIKEKGKLIIRNANMKRIKEEMEIVRNIYNKAWENNWGTVLLDEDDIEYITEELKPVLIEEAVQIAEFNDKPVGIGIGIPNIFEAIRDMNGKLNLLNIIKLLYRLGKIPFPSRPRLKTGRLLLLGVLEEYREGIGVILAAKLFKIGRKLGYKEAEGSLTLEDNYAINNLIKRLGGIPYKRFRVYFKEIV
ncbi:MAG: hypothetical protein ABIM60_00515 [candidate division WOR-3 bacterium]